MAIEELKYSKNHIWVKIEETSIIGITEFVTNQIGEIFYIELPKINTKIKRDEPLFNLESAKSVFEFTSPLSCEIIETNSILTKKPELLNKSPYEEGWIAKIKILSTDELNSLISYSEYLDLIKQQN